MSGFAVFSDGVMDWAGLPAAGAGGAVGLAIFCFGAAGVANFGGGGGARAATGGVSVTGGVFATIAGAGGSGFFGARFGISGAATLGVGLTAGTAGLATCVVRFVCLGGVGAVIFGGVGAITGAGGTIFGGGFTVGTAGLATCVRRFAGFGVFRVVRVMRFRSFGRFAFFVFGVAAFAVPRPAGSDFGATKRDFGIAAGGCFSGARFALRRAGFASGAIRTAGRVDDGRGGAGIRNFWISRASGVIAGRGDFRAGAPS